ncbi:hypothetical protein LZ023_31855 [Pseudomonas silvicola]|nr:hypothetical protein LZ023_31855 [Pseudomonas silvicola]
MDEFTLLLMQVTASLGLLTLGFSLRERDLGVLMIWFGMLCLLGIVLYKILVRIGA